MHAREILVVDDEAGHAGQIVTREPVSPAEWAEWQRKVVDLYNRTRLGRGELLGEILGGDDRAGSR